MKILKNKHIFILIATSLFFASCGSNNKNNVVTNKDETSGLTKIQEAADDNYTFSVYTNSDSLLLGYNEIYIQIKDNKTGQIVNNNDASLSWKPLMQMPTMSHSCPSSAIAKAANTQTLYEGFVIYQMAGSWSLILNYTINGQSSLDTVQNLTVAKAAQYQTREQTFTGSDGNKYILAMVAPTMSSVNVGTNKLTAYLFASPDMMQTFVPVTGSDTLKICPTMPGMPERSDPVAGAASMFGMGWTASPNNKDMVYNSATGLYEGQVNFNMSGYWKISMVLVDKNDQLIGGDTVTSADGNSLYFEVNF
jgi:hypothetical protein